MNEDTARYPEDDLVDLEAFTAEWDAEAAERQTEVLHNYAATWDLEAWLARIAVK